MNKGNIYNIILESEKAIRDILKTHPFAKQLSDEIIERSYSQLFELGDSDMNDFIIAKGILNLSIGSVFNKCESEKIFEKRFGFSFIHLSKEESSLDFINRKEKCLNDFKKSVDTSDINISTFEKRLKEYIKKEYRRKEIKNRLAFYLKNRVNIIFGIIIIILIYIFALNGRYKPIEGATYGIYIDSWTGKVHSSLIEFEKQNR